MMVKEMIEEDVGSTYAEVIIHSSSFAVDSNLNLKKIGKVFQ